MSFFVRTSLSSAAMPLTISFRCCLLMIMIFEERHYACHRRLMLPSFRRYRERSVHAAAFSYCWFDADAQRCAEACDVRVLRQPRQTTSSVMPDMRSKPHFSRHHFARIRFILSWPSSFSISSAATVDTLFHSLSPGLRARHAAAYGGACAAACA